MLKRLLAAVAVFALYCGTAKAEIVDDFTNVFLVDVELDAVLDVDSVDTADVSTQTGLSGVVNSGDRTTTLNWVSGIGGNVESLINTTFDALDYDSDTGIVGALKVAYSNLGSADLKANGEVSWALDVFFNDLSNKVKITAVDGTAASQSWIATIPAGYSGLYQIPFGVLGVDLNDVDDITVEFNQDGTAALDFRIQFIGTTNVPEPGTLALLGGGLLAVVRRRRRK